MLCFQGSKKKPKYMYKTAEEIIAKGGKRKKVTQSELSKVKVIDMTGREHRVLSGKKFIMNYDYHLSYF